MAHAARRGDGEDYFAEFENRLHSADIRELQKLIEDFPFCPSVWLAYARQLQKEDPNAALEVLREAAPRLRSLELWEALIDREAAQSTSGIQDYKTVKAAIDDVGHDPRSAGIWSNFFTKFVTLHNRALRNLAGSSGCGSSAPDLTKTCPVSSTAPLGDLVAETKPYAERESARVVEDISRFFVSAEKAEPVLQKAIEQATLTHPFTSAEVNMSSPTVDEHLPVIPNSELGALSASGDLNLKVYKYYVKKCSLTPLMDLSSRTAKNVLNTLDESERSDSAFNAIQKGASMLFEMYPKSIFSRPSSPMMACLDSATAAQWLRALERERNDCWAIRQADEALWQQRISFFLSVACRNCRCTPDIYFESAQFHFQLADYDEALRILRRIQMDKNIEDPRIDLVLADAYELIMNDTEKALNVLSVSLANKMEKNDKTSPKVISDLIRHVLIKKRRLAGVESWRLSVDALFQDEKWKPHLRESVAADIISMELFSHGRSQRAADLIQKCSLMWPSSPLFSILASLPLDSLPANIYPNEILAGKLYTLGEISENATSVQPDLLRDLITHQYFYGVHSAALKETFAILPSNNALKNRLLITPQEKTSYADYVAFITQEAIGLSRMFTGDRLEEQSVEMTTSGGFRRDQFINLIKMSYRIQQIHELVLSLTGAGGLKRPEELDSTDWKARQMVTACEKATEMARERGALSPVQRERLKQLLADELTFGAFQHWLRVQSSNT